MKKTRKDKKQTNTTLKVDSQISTFTKESPTKRNPEWADNSSSLSLETMKKKKLEFKFKWTAFHRSRTLIKCFKSSFKINLIMLDLNYTRFSLEIERSKQTSKKLLRSRKNFTTQK